MCGTVRSTLLSMTGFEFLEQDVVSSALDCQMSTMAMASLALPSVSLIFQMQKDTASGVSCVHNLTKGEKFEKRNAAAIGVESSLRLYCSSITM